MALLYAFLKIKANDFQNFFIVNNFPLDTQE